MYISLSLSCTNYRKMEPQPCFIHYNKNSTMGRMHWLYYSAKQQAMKKVPQHLCVFYDSLYNIKEKQPRNSAMNDKHAVTIVCG